MMEFHRLSQRQNPDEMDYPSRRSTMPAKQFVTALFAAAAILFTSAFLPAAAADGVIVVESANNVKTTMDKLEKALTAKGITVFARIDHAGGAKSIGQTLRPMELLIFGNPKLGTPLMQKEQRMGLDLPLKALVYEGADGKTYIAYSDPAYLSKRYGVTEPAKVLQTMTGALKNFTAAAAAK
jgi:uncharacterized protein (DUF302 family)